MCIRDSIEHVAAKIIESGFEVGVQSRIVWTFTGAADLTLYPSGKLLVKTEDKELAREVASLHTEQWAHA